jgi:hypothetical protein
MSKTIRFDRNVGPQHTPSPTSKKIIKIII